MRTHPKTESNLGWQHPAFPPPPTGRSFFHVRPGLRYDGRPSAAPPLLFSGSCLNDCLNHLRPEHARQKAHRLAEAPRPRRSPEPRTERAPPLRLLAVHSPAAALTPAAWGRHAFLLPVFRRFFLPERHGVWAVEGDPFAFHTPRRPGSGESTAWIFVRTVAAADPCGIAGTYCLLCGCFGACTHNVEALTGDQTKARGPRGSSWGGSAAAVPVIRALATPLRWLHALPRTQPLPTTGTLRALPGFGDRRDVLAAPMHSTGHATIRRRPPTARVSICTQLPAA